VPNISLRESSSSTVDRQKKKRSEAVVGHRVVIGAINVNIAFASALVPQRDRVEIDPSTISAKAFIALS